MQMLGCKNILKRQDYNKIKTMDVVHLSSRSARNTMGTSVTLE